MQATSNNHQFCETVNLTVFLTVIKPCNKFDINFFVRIHTGKKNVAFNKDKTHTVVIVTLFNKPQIVYESFKNLNSTPILSFLV